MPKIGGKSKYYLLYHKSFSQLNLVPIYQQFLF